MAKDRTTASERPQPGNGRDSAPLLALTTLAFLAGAVLRLLASRNDLWLDEIWSLEIARNARSALEIFTTQYLDNNHCLNTWTMRLLSGLGSDWVLRLPALLGGLVTVIVAGLIGRNLQGMVGAFVAVVVTGCSYLLIHYGSEARGYSWAGAAALLAWYALLQGEEARGWRWPALFWVAALAGVLSHATFIVQAYAGLLLWSFRRFQARSRKLPLRVALMRWHLAPILTILVFYIVHLRHMQFGGGPDFTWQFVLGRLAAFSLGLPAANGALGFWVLLAVILLGLSLWLLPRSGSDRWVIFGANCVVFPLLFNLLRQPERLFERYFFVSTIFFLMMLSHLLASGLQRRGIWRGVAAAVLLLFLVGNSVHTARLLRFGRGEYTAALRSIIAESDAQGGRIAVSSDHDFRNKMLIEYHGQRVAPGVQFSYVPKGELETQLPPWLILHSRDSAYPPTTEVKIAGRGVYRFRRAYPSAPMSGFYWTLLKFEPTGAPAGVAR